MKKVLVLAIRSRYTESILDGTKTVELRRTRPRVAPGDPVLIYATLPVQAIVGGFLVEELLETSPADLWNKVGDRAGVTRAEYDEYFSSATAAYGIKVAGPWRLPVPLSLEALRKHAPSFRPPRSYAYLEVGDGVDGELLHACGVDG